MNTIDNGVKEVISIERVITEDELYFLVTFKDYYGYTRSKKFMSIKGIEKASWYE